MNGNLFCICLGGKAWIWTHCIHMYFGICMQVTFSQLSHQAPWLQASFELPVWVSVTV